MILLDMRQSESQVLFPTKKSSTLILPNSLAMDFVPPQFRSESAPFQFMALNDAGQTVDNFYFLYIIACCTPRRRSASAPTGAAFFFLLFPFLVAPCK